MNYDIHMTICLVQSNTKHAWKYRFPENMGNGSQWWASRCGTATREPFFLLDTTPQDDSDSRYIKFLKVILSTQQEQGFWKKAMLGISDLIALRTTFWNIWCPYQSDKKSHDKMMLFFMILWFFKLWNDARLFRFAQIFTTFEIF